MMVFIVLKIIQHVKHIRVSDDVRKQIIRLLGKLMTQKRKIHEIEEDEG